MILNTFVTENLINGFQNGSFTIEQVNIFSLNYLGRGVISQADFDSIQVAIAPKEVPDETL